MRGAAAAPPVDRGKLNDRDVRRKLLLSHGITRMGTSGWLFIAPLVLVRFTPNSILGPAVFGASTMLATTLLGPSVGRWADRANRRAVITLGVLAQFVAVVGSIGVILCSLRGEQDAQGEGAGLAALGVFTFCGVVEKLGTLLSDVAVKREWAPQLFDTANQPKVNSAMSQIDLTTEVVGPFVAGLLITVGATEAVQYRVPVFSAEEFGFVVTGLLNAVSFWPQLALLRSIYRSHSEFLQPVPPDQAQPRRGPLPQSGSWCTWMRHPGGLRCLSLSYALLYLTVLSPHGALLTAYLMVRQASAWQLSLFRGAGALLGVIGALARPRLGSCLGNRLADSLSVCWLAAWMLVAFCSFQAAGNSVGLTAPLLVFCAAVCLGRPGLYSFELGILNQEQDLVDKRHRSAIGAIDSALTSLATLVMFVCGMARNQAPEFGILVAGSSLFVAVGAAVYLSWTVLYKTTRHRHLTDGAHATEEGHWYSHGLVDHEHHAHTLQMEESLEDGWHEHLVYDPRFGNVPWSRWATVGYLGRVWPRLLGMRARLQLPRLAVPAIAQAPGSGKFVPDRPR